MKAGIWCRFALGAVHVACVGVLICTSAAQGTVAVAIRNYGLQAGSEREILYLDDKAGLKEDLDIEAETIEKI